MVDKEHIYSNWSQRHVGYIAGLGTFGLNNMLITDQGTCGRFYSLITNLPVEPDQPLQEERCLWKMCCWTAMYIQKSNAAKIKIAFFRRIEMKYIELESERLLFRKYEMSDFAVFYDMLSNLENIKYRSYEPKTEQEVHEYIDWGMQCAEQNPCVNYRYAVVLKETGELIGSCELAFTDKDPAELAWELHRDYWRKGYGTEIGNTLLKLGFEILKLRRIIGDCNTLNTGSYRIMEKIGMRREAHYVKMYRGNSALNHQWCDKFLYAILREEYHGFDDSNVRS